MVAPGIVWLIVFCYIPMYGIVIAFNTTSPDSRFSAVPGSDWIIFRVFFHDKLRGARRFGTLSSSARSSC